MEPTPFDAARRALQAGDVPAAIREVRKGFSALELDPRIVDTAIHTLRDVGAAARDTVLAPALSALLVERTTGPGHPHRWYAAGCAAVEVGIPEAAVHLLLGGLALAPDDHELLYELCVALGDIDQHARALDHLERAPAAVRDLDMSRYLRAFHAVHAGDLATARRLQPGLARHGDHGFMTERIDRVLARADAIADIRPLNPLDLLGWHFVLSGSILLHLSPYGFDGPMHGRYSFVQESDGMVHLVLRRLVAVLTAIDLRPPRVLHTGDRGSELAATAAARLLGVPLARWQPSDTAPGLVVVDELTRTDPSVARALATHRAGQPLFALAASWTEPPGFGADLVGFLHQIRYPYWGERVVADPDAPGKASMSPADARPVSVIVDAILATPEDEEDGVPLEAVLAVATAGRRVASLANDTGSREHLWGGCGPVPSSRWL